MTAAQIEDKLIATVTALNIFATVLSAGRHVLPEVYAYPAAFVYWDGDSDTGSIPRPVDAVDFKIAVQVENLAGEKLAANDAYTVNDQVRNAIRGKTLGLTDIEPFVCLSRKCTDYHDSEGWIEYTHTYRTRLYNPVPVG